MFGQINTKDMQLFNDVKVAISHVHNLNIDKIITKLILFEDSQNCLLILLIIFIILNTFIFNWYPAKFTFNGPEGFHPNILVNGIADLITSIIFIHFIFIFRLLSEIIRSNMGT